MRRPPAAADTRSPPAAKAPDPSRTSTDRGPGRLVRPPRRGGAPRRRPSLESSAFRGPSMTAVKPAAPENREAGLATVRVVTETLRLVTDKRLELYNLTEKVADIVKRHDIKDGMVLLSSLHTTVALFVNEWQSALLTDVKTMLDKVVSPKDGDRK